MSVLKRVRNKDCFFSRKNVPFFRRFIVFVFIVRFGGFRTVARRLLNFFACGAPNFLIALAFVPSALSANLLLLVFCFLFLWRLRRLRICLFVRFSPILAVRKFAKSFAASMHSSDAGLRPFGHFVLTSFFSILDFLFQFSRT